MAKILIVEDDNSLRKIINVRLSAQGHDIFQAENGEIGVNKALKDDYDAILMDMYMPVLNGAEATLKLRENGYTGLIIGVSGCNTPKDKREAIDAGCDHYIIKPFPENFEHLVDVFIHTSKKKLKV